MKPYRQIFDSKPNSWRELEQFVAQVFQEMGCSVATQKRLDLPRGSVTVDVAIRDQTTVPHSFYICECKNWSRRVSQSEIYAFRTVVHEAGANRGFLISSSGFQPGAMEAVEFTNIDLLTWEGFESLMFEKWLTGVVRAILPFLTYASKLLDCSDDELWKNVECNATSWKKLEDITEIYQLILPWKIFDMSSDGRNPNWVVNAVVDMTAISPIDGRPVNTFRRFADQAGPSALRAIVQLEEFWRLEPQ